MKIVALSLLFFALTLYSMYLPIYSNVPIWVFPFTRVNTIFAKFAYEQNIPFTHGVLKGYNGRYLQHIILPPTNQRLWNYESVTRWELKARPIVGDHIHMDASFWINDKPRINAEHDRHPIEQLEYEPPFGKDEHLCKVPGNISYEKMWPHAGVHTHCDGLIHVHPWSAPRVIRKEGLDVTLGMWFDQVGVRYYENGLEFSDGQRFDNNATHRWRVAEWTCYENNEPPTIYTRYFDQIWLGHAHASYVIWYGKSSIPPHPIPSHRNHLKQVGAHGFNHEEYPHQC